MKTLMTIDSFEFGENYENLDRYKKFKSDTSFINDDI